VTIESQHKDERERWWGKKVATSWVAYGGQAPYCLGGGSGFTARVHGFRLEPRIIGFNPQKDKGCPNQTSPNYKMLLEPGD